MENFDLDRFDLAIIEQLERDGRITIAALARAIGLSKTPCQNRLRRLEAEGYITGYRALVDQVKFGRGHVAFVQATLNDTRERSLAAFNAAVRKIPEVEQCHMIAGEFDYLLKVRTRSMEDYRRVLGNEISALPHVASTSTFVSMEAVKDEGF